MTASIPRSLKASCNAMDARSRSLRIPCALEKFAWNTDCADVVLLDYFMPTLDGGQTVQHLRKLNPDIKVVLFSGAEEMHLRQIMKQHPIDAFVHKPLRIDEALFVIRKLVGEPSGRVLSTRA